MISQNITLTPKAQWSLILFVGSFIVNIAEWLIAMLANSEKINELFFIFELPITATLYLFSAILGLLTLKTSKFPVLWALPCSIMAISFLLTFITDFSRLLSFKH